MLHRVNVFVANQGCAKEIGVPEFQSTRYRSQEHSKSVSYVGQTGL